MSNGENLVGGLVLEDSRSRTGRHIAKSILLVYTPEKGLLTIDRAPEYVVEREKTRPTYVRGSAEKLYLRLRHGEYVIYGWFVRNFLGRVKGVISVYNHRGELVYRAKYRDGILVRSIGDPVYAWLVRLFVEKARIPVKKSWLGDEK